MDVYFCRTCGSQSFIEKEQTFKDGTKHIRIECEDGHFNGYKRQHDGFDKMILKDHLLNTDYSITYLTSAVHIALSKLAYENRNKKISVVVKVR